jgi:acyl carrier protein
MNHIDDNEIMKEVRNIISKITRIEKNKISENASLRDELMIDSLQAVQIVSMIEVVFEIKIDEIEIFNVDNLNEIVGLIKEYKNFNKGK